MAVTTASDYKTWNPAASAEADATITAWIAQATAEVERYCGVQFESAAHTEEWIGDGNQRRKLSRRPATAVSAVVIVNQDGTTSAVASSTYSLDPDGVFLDRYPLVRGRGRHMTNGWPRDSYDSGLNWCYGQKYRATMTVGYAPGAAELDIAKSAIHQYLDVTLGDRGKGAFQSEAGLSYNYTRLASADRAVHVRQILAPFVTGGGYA